MHFLKHDQNLRNITLIVQHIVRDRDAAPVQRVLLVQWCADVAVDVDEVLAVRALVLRRVDRAPAGRNIISKFQNLRFQKVHLRFYNFMEILELRILLSIKTLKNIAEKGIYKN